jgi:hypothetical protein
MKGKESPYGGDCGRAGWLQTSLDGRWLFAGDEDDVIDLRTHRVEAFLPALHNSRYLCELDWRRGHPVRTSTRSGMGYPAPKSWRPCVDSTQSRAPAPSTARTCAAH